ncbi:NmrA family NAD(P)-binding protein [Tunturiibacter psychrotolerans]|uniref:NmrA family NAD(P)-binding protein n=1 Tax=Tunturiibacter psychrotolerans TaxID=3069686 RepID=UPI003D1B2105
MQKPLTLVTGATGKTGAATIKLLLAQGYPVRAMARRADERSARLRQAGAEVVVGSIEDATDLRTAMAGVQRAYYCPPLEPGTLRRAALFAAVALESKLEAVVVMSQWLAEANHPAIHAREKWLSEKVFQWAAGLDVVTINPGFFADNYMLALEPIAHFGLMGMPLGDGLNAPPSNEDIARVIVGALVNPAPHIGKTYRPTGPKSLAPEEIAAVIGKVLGRKVKYQNVPINLFLKVAKSLKIDDFVIEELYWFLRDYQRNSFGVGAPTSAVLEVGCVEAEGFETTVQRYIARSAFRERTIGSTFTAIHNLLAGLLTPAPSPESIAGRLKLPSLNHPSLAADSASWHALHMMDHHLER